MYPVESKRFAVGATSVCLNCRQPIEWRLILGWVHVNGWFTCGIKAEDGKYKTAMPV